MEINWGFRPKKRTSGMDGEPSQVAETRPSEQHRWTAGASMTTRAAVWSLWAALLAGPVALGVQLLSPGTPQNAQPVTTTDPSGQLAAVGEFAQRAVVAWLETPPPEAGRLSEYFGDLDHSRPGHPLQANEAEVAEIAKDGSGLWSVVVGVDVTQPDPATSEQAPVADDGDRPAQPRADRLYFQIPILYVQGDMVAQALPAVVTGPEPAEQIASAYEAQLTSTHPAYARVRDFLHAMLVTGNRAAIEAYSVPGSSFRPVDPTPFAAMELRSIAVAGPDVPSEQPADGERAEIQATVGLIGADGQGIQAQYALVLVAREGRWEVAETPNVPALAEPVPTPSSSPRPASSPARTGQQSEPPGEPAETSGSPEQPDDTTDVPWDDEVTAPPSADPAPRTPGHEPETSEKTTKH